MRWLLSAAAVVALALPAAAESFTVRVQEAATIEIPGATAAYTIDAAIADAAIVRPGAVSVTGRAAGTTQLIAVTPSGTKAYLITVAASHPVNVPNAVRTGQPIGRLESRYSSGASQVQTSFDVFTTGVDRSTQFHLLNVHYLRDTFGRSTNAFPSVFYRVTSPGRELTLLDDIVDLSPVTIRSTPIRGIHLRQGPLELHGGYAASTQYEDLFLPADRRWVAGASYAIDRGELRWIPSAYGFFSEPRDTAARRGAVGSLAVEHRSGDALFARGELAVSHSLAAATEIRYETPVDLLHGRAWHKPEDFPTLGLSDVPGTHGELEWSRRATSRLTIDSYGTFDRLSLAGSDERVAVMNVVGRYAISHLTMLGGVETTSFRAPASAFRTIGVPIGFSADWPGFGAALSYRVLDTSNTARRGDTIRLSARASAGMFHFSGWAERQRRAPTLDLIFREEPALEAALIRLGISVRTPQDLARVLRDNAALINLGFIEGATVNLTPRHLQAGLDVGVLPPNGRDQLRLHAVFDHTERIGSNDDSTLATLTYSRRILDATDVYGSFTWWRSAILGLDRNDTAVEIGFRQRFDGVPQFLRHSGSIQGVVFLDPQMHGVLGNETTPLAGIEVTLDGAQTVKTDSKGVYVFRDVKPGPHRVAAHLPATRPSFFTTSSRVEVDVPGHADFGLVWTPARIDGRVLSDANLGIPGIVVSATAEQGKPITTTTDTEGAFVLATPPGRYTIALAAESLPPGYTIGGESSRTVIAKPDQPEKVAFELHALRSIAGQAPGASEVRIEPLGRTATTDAGGNFVFRSLPAGTYTLTAQQGDRIIKRSITLPAEPTTLRDVVLGEPGPQIAETPSTPLPLVRPVQRKPTSGDFRVQVGAYRVPSNAAAQQEELVRLGYRPEITRAGALQIVSIGPFETRSQAEAESSRLSHAGIESVVITNRPEQAVVESSSGRSFFVQLGAFREAANARQLIRRLGKLGQHPQAVDRGGLTFVHAGPFRSRTAATRLSERLRRAGFESLVTQQ